MGFPDLRGEPRPSSGASPVSRASQISQASPVPGSSKTPTSASTSDSQKSENDSSKQTKKGSADKSQDPEMDPKKKAAMDRKTEILSKVLKYGTSLERKAGLVEIEKLPKENLQSIKPLIVESLKKEKEPTMRIAFIRLVGDIELVESLEEVEEALADENEDLARQAVSAMKKLNPPNGWEKVLARLKTEDLTRNSNLTASLIEALGEMDGGENASEFMESKLKENFNSPDIRAQIALYLGKKKIKSAETSLQKIAFEEREGLTLRTYSINSLGKIGSQSSVPKLKELIEELRNNPSQKDSRKNQLLKIYSLAALIDLGAEGSFEEIVEFTRDDDSVVRLKAVQFLAEIKNEESREIMEYKSLRDPNPKIQRFAKESLEKWDEASTEGEKKDPQNKSKSSNSNKPDKSKSSQKPQTEENSKEKMGKEGKKGK